MEKPLVTIVLPIYNVEKYLERCINSVVNQTYANLEILLVDDASPDRCPHLCDEWAQKDKRIRVIHNLINEGQGIGRNKGLAQASGKYICFLDSDDYLEKVAVEKLVNVAETEKAELVVFDMKSVALDCKDTQAIEPKFQQRTFRNNEVQEVFLPEYLASSKPGDKKVPYMSACMILYTVSTLKNLRWNFVSERKIISEDVYSLLDLFDRITSVTILPDQLYCYCYNNNSFSREYMPGRYDRIRHFYTETIELCRKKKYGEAVIQRVSKPYLAYTIATLKQEAKAHISLLKRLNNMRQIIKDNILQNVLVQNKKHTINWRQKILFFGIEKKWTLLCYLLCVLQG